MIRIEPEALGSAAFRADHGARLACVGGGMVKGIASVAWVKALCQSGMLSFYGAGGQSADTIETEVTQLAQALGPETAWGVNFLHNYVLPQAEERVLDILLRHGVRRLEASAFVTPSPALVRFRALGMRRAPDGAIRCEHKIMAKLSRPEVAAAFLAPAEAQILQDLVVRGAVSAAQAELAAQVPLADDIVVEADSGGHTDRRVALALFPAILRQRETAAHGFPPAGRVRIGAAGGIGAPEAAAAAFMMGADFVMTGSINQATPEAGTSETVKDMLAQARPQDFAMAPAGDMFEIGTQVQVLRRRTMFAVRGNRLYEMYRRLASWDDIPAAERAEIERAFFGRSAQEVWRETSAFYARAAPTELAEAEANPKKKMAMIFRWYFIHTNRLAMEGDPDQRSNFQIHSGPAMAACNAWLAQGEMSDWRARRVDRLNERLMAETAEHISQKVALWSGQAGLPQRISERHAI